MKRFSETRALPWPEVFSRLANFQIDFLERLLDMVNTQRNKALEELKQRAKEEEKEDFRRTKQEYEASIDAFVDERWLLDEAQSQAEQLSIVGLYRTVEFLTKKIISRPYYGHKAKIKECHDWCKLKKNLEKDFFGFDLSNIVSYDTVDELRRLNNAIKHNDGVVTAKLAEFSGWKEGEKIRNLRPHFDRFAAHIPKYLADFTEKLNDQLA